MPQIVVLPNADLCPNGEVIQAQTGISLAQALLNAGIDLPHACELSCACTTCHVMIREGQVDPAAADEVSITRNSLGFGPCSRLSYQIMLGRGDLVIEIP